MKNTTLHTQALSLLSRFYGYSSFRPGQYDIIEAICNGRDVLVLMPTGGGKSLCYQLPALLAPAGCAIVISPLIALMQDQTQALQANGIPAAAIHSNQSESDNARILEAASSGLLKLLYISPERFLADIDTIRSQVRVSLFAIDEAHCISQWGHDFRPEYTQLQCIQEQFADTPVIALTATADRLTRADIATHLGLRDPFVYISSFDRPNISLRAYPNPGIKQRVRVVAGLARKYGNDTGIVYCLSRANVESFNEALCKAGIRSVPYHAGMTASQRNSSLKDFLDGRAQVVCATVAFGMGIDKSNIRWVVHNNLPSSIENYYQEIGRAGRDGLPAEAILFHSYSDIIARQKFAADSGQKTLNMEKLNRMREYAEARVCRRRILLSYFSEESTRDCGNCDVCLSPPERIDGTILAQKALSAVARTGWTNIGLFTVVGILRGLRSADIIGSGYHRLPTYGVGADLNAAQWTDYIRQMIQLGVFEIAYDDANHLRVTDLGHRILRGEQNITLSKYVPPIEKEKKVESAPQKRFSDMGDSDAELFEALRICRKEIADRTNKPPFIIFNDRTLREMAALRPRTIDELRQVSGVGEYKAHQWGTLFLEVIAKTQQ